MQTEPVGILVALALAGCIYYAHSRRVRRSCLPPGPPGIPLPFIGNMFDMPKESPWLTFLQWGREYQSDIIYLNAGGTEMIVLNTLETITDLLEKRGSIYSGRFQSTMVKELMGWEFDLGFATYNEKWREERRMFAKEFTEKATKQFRHVQTKVINQLVRNLIDTPDRWPHHVRHQVAALSMDVGYGIDLPEDDPFIAASDLANEGLAVAAVPGRFWVDSFPILKHVPSWLPGAGFKQEAKIWKEGTDYMVNGPFEKMKKLAAQGLARASYASARLQAMDPNGDLKHQEDVIRNTSTQVNIGGADTTGSALSGFILAMVKYPDVQRKLQAELDAVVGKGRIPDFDEEEESLPYLTACTKECYRWNQIVPLAIAHRLEKDDVYRGYAMPKNALFFANSWAVLNDPQMYPEPSEFRPERYLGPDGKQDPTVRDPRGAAFGYGRRVCPGMHLALSTVWIAAASLLSVFNIEQAVDENGKAVDVSAAFTTGFFRHPESFQCKFVPRSPEILKSFTDI